MQLQRLAHWWRRGKAHNPAVANESYQHALQQFTYYCENKCGAQGAEAN
jgi:hypothetical protein